MANKTTLENMLLSAPPLSRVGQPGTTQSPGGIVPAGMFPNSGAPLATTGGAIQPPQYRMSTGLPPTQATTFQTGGPLPPTQIPGSTGTANPTGSTNTLSGFSPAQLLQQMIAQTGGVPTGPNGIPSQWAQLPSLGDSVSGPSGVPTGNINEMLQRLMAQFAGQTPDELQRQDRNQLVQDSLNFFEDRGSQYMTNAARRGLEVAGQRGLGNSSIAGGAAQRAALESIQPFVQNAVDINNMREQQDFQARESALGRNLQRQLSATGMGMDAIGRRETLGFQGAQNALDRTQQRDLAEFNAQAEALARREGITFEAAQNQLNRQLQVQQQQFGFLGDLISQREGQAFQGEQAQLDRDFRQQMQQDTTFQQDWLSGRNFEREFNAQLSMMPLQSAYELNSMMNQYAMDNPEIYTPDIISGMNNFLQQNLFSILSQYFPGTINTTGGAS